MKLYIQVENGVTKNHPAFEDNLLQAFGSIPDTWEPFTRIGRPTLGVYELLDSEEPVYTKVNNVWTDVWLLRNMTAEEKITKQQTVLTIFNDHQQASNWLAWTLDEATCTMQPPIPRPDPIKGKIVFWCGADNNWKETPARLEGEYKFDFFAWNWVAV